MSPGVVARKVFRNGMVRCAAILLALELVVGVLGVVRPTRFATGSAEVVRSGAPLDAPAARPARAQRDVAGLRSERSRGAGPLPDAAPLVSSFTVGPASWVAFAHDTGTGAPRAFGIRRAPTARGPPSRRA